MALKGSRRPMSEINVVPYIDVMLVLLVIFMITAPLLKTGVEVELPRADAQPMEAETEPLVLTVDRDGNLYLNVGEDPESPLAEQEVITLAAAVMRRNEERRVLVRGDGAVDDRQVARGMTLLQRAGVPHVGLVFEGQ